MFIAYVLVKVPHIYYLSKLGEPEINFVRLDLDNQFTRFMVITTFLERIPF